ncbi:MAG TPA: M23 family metallopeptidase [Stenotrophomonas sp.]|nr:M23 family metallopeptidase [Stenotrophomonas sp.]
MARALRRRTRAPGSSTRPNRPFNEYDRDNDGKLDCWKSAGGKPSEARISSRYGASTWRPGNFHYGVDIASHTANFGLGQRVRAIADGVVSPGEPKPANGNYVRIVHGDGRVSLYLHLRDILRSKGQVRAGDEIGTMNCTGNCGKPPRENTVQSTHVHIEIKTSLGAPRVPANRIDPIVYLGNCQR